MMKTLICRAFRVVRSGALLYIGLLLAFSAALLAANAIPTAPMEKQLSESYDRLSQEAIPQNWMADMPAWRLDNFTTAIMLNIAGNGDDLGVRGAFGAYRYTGEKDQIANFGASISAEVDRANPAWRDYARYWNGWTCVIKPLLLIMNLNQIRTVFFLGMSTGILWVTLKLVSGRGIGAGLAFAIPFFAVSYPAVCFSLSLAFSFFVAIAAVWFVLWKVESLECAGKRVLKLSCWWPMFFVVGGVTVFFDFLCTPVITLGVPLLVLLVLAFDELRAVSVCRIVAFIAAMCMSWGLAYAGLWAGKWVLSSIVLQEDVVSDALRQLFYRSSEGITAAENGGSAAEITALGVIDRNASVLFPKWACAALLPVVVVACAYLGRTRGISRAFCKAGALPCALMAVLPYAWHVAVSNHSWVHRWFTYRSQLVTVMAILFLFYLWWRCPRGAGGPEGTVETS